MKKIWFISLCALLVLGINIGWSIPLRIAVGANAIVILISVIRRIGGLINERTEEKN